MYFMFMQEAFYDHLIVGHFWRLRSASCLLLFQFRHNRWHIFSLFCCFWSTFWWIFIAINFREDAERRRRMCRLVYSTKMVLNCIHFCIFVLKLFLFSVRPQIASFMPRIMPPFKLIWQKWMNPRVEWPAIRSRTPFVVHSEGWYETISLIQIDFTLILIVFLLQGESDDCINRLSKRDGVLPKWVLITCLLVLSCTHECFVFTEISKTRMMSYSFSSLIKDW